MIKKILLFGIGGCMSLMTANSQITVTSADVAGIGAKIMQAYDTLPHAGTFSLGSAGASQTWDFSDLYGDFFDSLLFVDPAGEPEAADFPTANLAIIPTLGPKLFIEQDANKVEGIGFSGDLAGIGQSFSFPFQDGQLRFKFPMTYLSAYSDSDFFSTVVVLPVPIPIQTPVGTINVDSVKISHRGYKTSNVDAWGDLIMPTGTFSSLREYIVEYSLDSISINNPFPIGDPWILFNTPEWDTSASYNWVANGVGYPILTIDLDSMGNMDNIVSIPPSNIISICECLPEQNYISVFPNPSNGSFTVDFKDVEDPDQILIYNSVGQLVRAEVVRNNPSTMQIDLSGQAAGNYIIKVFDRNGVELSGRKFTIK